MTLSSIYAQSMLQLLGSVHTKRVACNEKLWVWNPFYRDSLTTRKTQHHRHLSTGGKNFATYF